jgi:hypothetical protein
MTIGASFPFLDSSADRTFSEADTLLLSTLTFGDLTAEEQANFREHCEQMNIPPADEHIPHWWIYGRR